jgi:hypothetical protein
MQQPENFVHLHVVHVYLTLSSSIRELIVKRYMFGKHNALFREKQSGKA